MKKSFAILLNFGFWFCFAILIFILLMVYNRSSLPSADQAARMLNAFKNLLFFAIVPSIITYLCFYFLLFPAYLKKRKFIIAAIYGIIIAIITCITCYFIHRHYIESGWIKNMDKSGNNSPSSYIRVIAYMTFISLISGMIALCIQGFINWLYEIRLKEQLSAKNFEMEMALVKSQLDPHLLFNTINNIDALILKDAVMASKYLNQLSEIMRFILYETKTELILLHKEVEYMEKYISLQKIRTANLNYVNFSVTGYMGNRLIAPMVFIPFIENAFKHTHNKKLENAITIHILINENSIQLTCTNRFETKPANHQLDSGLGNELIKKRLELLYKGKHIMHVDKKNELYTINLTIPNG